MIDGVLAVHKPKGWTSHDVVARLRGIAQTRRVGHCGTLDPMAEGLLLCCLNRATCIVPWLTGLAKEYTGEIVLGASSDTYDAEGAILAGLGPSGLEGEEERLESAPRETFRHGEARLEAICLAAGASVAPEAILEAFRAQTGDLEQAAPPYSAVKVGGRKLYEYARSGQNVPRKVRRVRVDRFDLLRYVAPRATFLARVGSGTYIRSMAHEVGRRLGTGAYLSALVRTSVGSFHLDDATPLEQLEAEPEMLAGALLSIGEALVHLPKIVLTPEAAERMRHGSAFDLEGVLECEGPAPVGEPALALSPEGEALAVVQSEADGAPWRPLRVLAAANA